MNSTLLLSGWGRRLGKKLMKNPRITEIPTGPEPIKRWNIVRGDVVQVTQGPYSGQQGKVLTVIRDKQRVIIEGVNMRRRIRMSRMQGTPGKIILTPCSIHYSNISLVDPSTGRPTKISRQYTEDGSKVRVSRASGQIIPKPNPLANKPPRTTVVGPKDTTVADVFSVTFGDYEKFSKYIYARAREGK